MIPIILTCGPNEVIVVSGLCYSPPALIQGGRIIVIPGLHRWTRLSLNVMTLKVSSPGVYTVQGVPIQVTGVAQVKVASQHLEMLASACEHFLNKSAAQIEDLLTQTLEGHQRGIMGTMTVEEIYKSRKLFAERVFEVASRDLCNLGITVLSYTIRDITDDQGYLKALGMSRTAEVMRDARIGEASARKESSIQKSLANEKLQEQQYMNQTQVAAAERDYMLKKAAYDGEVNSKQAEANLAYKLQESITKQKIKEEEMKIKVVERAAKIQVEEQEMIRRQKHLEANVRQPAVAEKFRMEKIAEAQRQSEVMRAEAQAEAIFLKSQAEAHAIQAKAKAENEEMTQKANAWKEYGQAALLDMYLSTIPKVAAKVGGSLKESSRIKMISSKDSGVGAAKLTSEIIDITTGIPKHVADMTGIDLLKNLQAIKMQETQ